MSFEALKGACLEHSPYPLYPPPEKAAWTAQGLASVEEMCLEREVLDVRWAGPPPPPEQLGSEGGSVVLTLGAVPSQAPPESLAGAAVRYSANSAHSLKLGLRREGA